MVLLSTEVRFFSGSAGFETARRETVWKGLLPKRFPDVIVQARDIDDVIASIRYAKEYGHQVGVRSGGHSWAARGSGPGFFGVVTSFKLRLHPREVLLYCLRQAKSPRTTIVPVTRQHGQYSGLGRPAGACLCESY